MGWEDVEALPGTSSGGGAFRDGAEPVVAQRIGLSLREKLRLFWHSTPDLPSARAAELIVVTQTYVYVRRVDKTRARVHLDELHGQRVERGLLVFGVAEDDDLLLAYRPSCPVQDRLMAALRKDADLEPWRESRGMIASAILTLASLGAGVGLLLSYPLERALEHIEIGLFTSESALGTYAGVAALFLALFLFFLGPSRWRVDAVGVTRTRGVLPWMPFTLPPERFRRAVLKPSYYKPKNQRRYHAGWFVVLDLRDRARVGTLCPTASVSLGFFPFGRGRLSAEDRRRTENEARALAERFRSLLSLAATEVFQVRP